MNPTHSKFVLDSYASIQENARSLSHSLFFLSLQSEVGRFQTKKSEQLGSNEAKIWLSNERIQTKHENKWKNSSNENQLFSTKEEEEDGKHNRSDRKAKREKKLTLNTYSPLTNGLLKLYAFREENQINEREKMK